MEGSRQLLRAAIFKALRFDHTSAGLQIQELIQLVYEYALSTRCKHLFSVFCCLPGCDRELRDVVVVVVVVVVVTADVMNSCNRFGGRFS